LTQPPPMPLQPPMPMSQPPPPLPMMGHQQQHQNMPPRLPTMPRNGVNPPAGLQPTPPGMSPPLPLNQVQHQQQQHQRESNLLAQMQSMNMNMNGHQMQQQQQHITKSIAELEQSVIQQAQQRQQLQQQEQMLMRQQQQRQQLQNSGGFGDELGGGIFSSTAKNTHSFGFGASPLPTTQQQQQQQQPPPLQQALFGGSGGSSQGSGLDIFGNPMPQNFNSAFEGLRNSNNNESVTKIFEREQQQQRESSVFTDDNDSPNGLNESPRNRESRNAFRRGGRGKNSSGLRAKKHEHLNGDFEGGVKSFPQPRQ